MELPRQPPSLAAELKREGQYQLLPDLVVGALRLNMSRLLALVADLLATSRLLGAVTGVVSGTAAVVAFHAVDTLAYTLVSAFK
jgi:hypothetical protein